MKKIISFLLCMTLLVSCVPVFADADSSVKMQEVLIKVKSKVNIPDILSEFTPRTYEHNGKTSYEFDWSAEDKDANISITCDDEGRINGYYFYDEELKSNKKITSLSKEDIINFAEEFLKKTIPEAYVNDNDTLCFDEDSWYVYENYYSFSFDRCFNYGNVKDNYVNFGIGVYEDVPYVKNMNSYYDFEYDGEFVFNEEFIINHYDCLLEYSKHFPVEMIYRDVYSYGDDKTKTALVYQFTGGGYISTVTNEEIKEDVSEVYGSAGGGGALKNDSVASPEVMLTDKELEELKNVEGLISKDEADKILRSLPYLDLDRDMTISSFKINQRNDDYVVSIAYDKEKDYKHLSATLDGKSGKLLNLYSYSSEGSEYNKKELTESQKKNSRKKVEEFINKVAPQEFSQCKFQEDSSYSNTYTANYDRYVNDIRYINDGIDVTFNVKTGMVTNYRLDFEEDKVFDDPSDTVSVIKAINEFSNKKPIKEIYIKSDGKYQQCYTIENQSIQLDAFTGEEFQEYSNYEREPYKYTDVDGHWAEEQITKLAEIQIGFNGTEFNPDAPISQYDLLRLFGAGIRYQNYLTYSKHMLYDDFINEGILTKEEKNPEGQVLREDAFVYMVRIDGLEKVAKLSDIFKVEYADGNLLSDGKIGYPAILTGMGIICGNGGYLKPKTPITRAEAAVMVYNYMINEN